jgi:hypothetical protein
VLSQVQTSFGQLLDAGHEYQDAFMNSSDVVLQLLNQSIAASQALVSQASDTAQVCGALAVWRCLRIL